MPHGSRPIQRTLITALLLISGAVMLTTAAAFFAYDFLTYRHATVRNLATLGEAIAANSTAALAFDNADDAREVLSAFRAESHVIAAGLYTRSGALFASYPAAHAALPAALVAGDGYRFEQGRLIGVQPVVQGGHRMGTLYLTSDMGAIYERFRSFSLIAGLVLALACLVAYVLSMRLQRQISRPIMALTDTVSAISKHDDYAARAPRPEGYELGLLTDAFNRMLTRIGETQGKLHRQLGRLDLLQRITRAIGERQDLASIFRVVLRNLEDELSIDFGCVCLYDADAGTLSIATIGARSRARTGDLALEERDGLPIDPNGLARCVSGQLVYEPDVAEIAFPFPQRFARAGLRSLVLAPLLVENRVFGVLVVARAAAEAFSSAECEFLRHLSEHVALAAHQTQLYEALQRAYDDLHQSQQAVMQQERLRALGQMASGIAHDINNAISPIALYTESLLEREPGLSDRARNYLTTIQRAIEDVAETVARMREFYRQREPELSLSRVDLNRLIAQVIELTRARWSDVPLQQGIVIRLQTELAPDLAVIMGSEVEIRDALTNLVFNAVDAMPDGGTLTLRTLCTLSRGNVGDESFSDVLVEVSDTGVGMNDETRRRCLEPFYTTKGERGTGLGLAMVYGMIQRHSAELEIDSVVGKGTTVRVLFGAAQAQLVDTERSAVRLQPAQRLRILLVDDDPLLIKSLRDILEGDGHVITVADGGQHGIDTFLSAQQRANPFSLVITDLGMPYVDGRKVAAAVKVATPSTPVIMLTGWGRRLLAENDIPPYVDRVLSKPPRLVELRAALAELTVGSARLGIQEAS
jgi:signal transduction histidine kinase/ActR/RegA family two-component response regulator/HAMP domain-containing protein